MLHQNGPTQPQICTGLAVYDRMIKGVLGMIAGDMASHYRHDSIR
jgi:hypothetical protein